MDVLFKLKRHLFEHLIEESHVDPQHLASDKSTTSTNYVFIMIFLILALGYLIILILIVYRGKTVYSRPTTILVAKIFYFLGFVLSAFRVISSVLLIIESYNYDYTSTDDTSTEQQDDLAKLLYNGLYISDVVFGMMYLSLFWYIILYSYKSHVRIGNVLEDGKNPAASNKGQNIYTFILIIYSLVHLIFICLYNLGVQNLLNSQFYISCICANNAICIFYFIIGIFLLKFKFSGAPYKSNTLEREMRHLEKMGYFWEVPQYTNLYHRFTTRNYLQVIHTGYSILLSQNSQILILIIRCLHDFFFDIKLCNQNIIKLRVINHPSNIKLIPKQTNVISSSIFQFNSKLFGRCFETTLDILIIVNSQEIQSLIVGKEQNQGIFWNVISYFILPANYIIAEVVPLLYSLLQESAKIFSKNPHTNQESLILVDENDNPVEDQLNNTEDMQDSRDNQNVQKESFNSDIQDTNIIKINKETKFIKQLEKKEKKRGFGFIQKVLHEKKKKIRDTEKRERKEFRQSGVSTKSGQPVIGGGDDDDNYSVLAFRILPINTLSSWILQEVNLDIYNLKRLHLKNISKVTSLATDNNQVCLISKYYEYGSLSEILSKNSHNIDSSKSSQHSLLPFGSENKNGMKTDAQNTQYLKRYNINSTTMESQLDFKFSLESKMKISIQIAKTMAKLHKIGIIHGHLSSSNILFDKKYEVKISDIGLTSLKKLMSIRFGYQNKTHFTAPEHLQENSLIVKNPTSKSDIYSFAFILWELFMEREAFGNLNLEELKKTIITDNSRPKIPESGPIPKEVATIIRYCWLANPQERPEFGVILANLKRINNESPDDDEEFVFDEQEYKLSFKDGDQLKEQYNKGLGVDSEEEDDDEEMKFRQYKNKDTTQKQAVTRK